MILVVTIDDRNGMMFNMRRQSQDRVQRMHLLELAKNGKLWMNEYSGKLFASEKVFVDNDFLTKAGANDYCFVEDMIEKVDFEKVDKIVIYKWNRKYPNDVIFEMKGKWTLKNSEDFVGSSHDKITVEMYERG